MSIPVAAILFSLTFFSTLVFAHIHFKCVCLFAVFLLLSLDFFSSHFVVVCTDFNQYYNLAVLKDFERTGAAFGFGSPNDFLPPINSLKATTLKQYQSTGEPVSSISKKPSSNYYLRVVPLCCFSRPCLFPFRVFVFSFVSVYFGCSMEGNSECKVDFNEWFNSNRSQ